MADPTFIDLFHDKGWWAALGFVGLAIWRSLAIGQRIGRIEQTQEHHTDQLRYIINRLDNQ